MYDIKLIRCMKLRPCFFLSEMDILAVTHYPEMNIQNFFWAKIGVFELIRCMKLRPCSFLSEMYILAVMHYPEMNIQTFFELKSAFLSLSFGHCLTDVTV